MVKMEMNGAATSQAAETIDAAISFDELIRTLRAIPADKIALMMEQLDVAKNDELHNYDGYEQLCAANNVAPLTEEEFDRDRCGAVKKLYSEALPKTLDGLPQNIRDAITPVFTDAVAHPERFKTREALTKKLLTAVFTALQLPAGWGLIISRMVKL
jgi:hypothetical protein